MLPLPDSKSAIMNKILTMELAISQFVDGFFFFPEKNCFNYLISSPYDSPHLYSTQWSMLKVLKKFILG